MEVHIETIGITQCFVQLYYVTKHKTTVVYCLNTKQDLIHHEKSSLLKSDMI